MIIVLLRYYISKGNTPRVNLVPMGTRS